MVNSQNLEIHFLPDFDNFSGFLDSFVGKFGNMTQTFEFVAKFNKNAEFGNPRNFSAHGVARFVRRHKRFPRARRNIFYRKRHPPSGSINAGDNRINFLVAAQKVFRMFDLFRPRNIRNVNKPVNAVFNLDKRAEIRQIANFAVNSVADVIAFAHRFPRIRHQLFHSQTDAVVVRINAENLNFDFFAFLQKFLRAARAF